MSAPLPATAEHMPTTEHLTPASDPDATEPALVEASGAGAGEVPSAAPQRSIGDMLPMLVGGIGAALVTVLGGVIIVLLSALLQANAERFDEINERFDEIDERFDEIDERLAAQDAKIAEIDQKLTAKIAEIDQKLTALIAALNMAEQVDAAVEGKLLDASGDTGSQPPSSN